MKQIDLSKKVCRVYDYGLFTGLDMALGPLNDGFGTVEIFRPWMDSFCEPSPRYVGRDLPGVKRIWEFWEDMDSVDTFFFPDVGDQDIQQKIRGEKRACFGTGGRPKEDGKPGKAASELEFDRVLFKKTLIRRGLAVPPWKDIIGIDALRELAQTMPEPFNNGFYVKPDVGERRIFETFFVESYEKAAAKIDAIGAKLGVARNRAHFMIEAKIEGVEPGSDFFVNQGIAYPIGLYGWENKGVCYTSVVKKMDEMPSAIKTVNKAMAPVLKEYFVEGAISTEIRVARKNRVPHYIDGCFRFGNPPGGGISTLYKNFPQIVRGIAHGEYVEPEFRGTHMAEIGIDAADASTDPVPFEFSEKDWMKIKLRTACRIGDEFFHIPFPQNGCTVAKAVGWGKSREEAEYNCLEAAESFKCPGKSYEKSAFDELAEDTKEGMKLGLPDF